MLSKKRGQISANVFIYILTLFVIGIILLLGVNYISTIKDKISTTELLVFKNKLASDVRSIGQDYGTFKKVSYSLPGSAELCLVDLRGEVEIGTEKVNIQSKILESELIEFYPLIKDSIQSKIKKNAFILGPNTFESYYIGDITLNHFPYFKCLKSTAGKIEVGIEGFGNRALIITDFKATAILNPNIEIILKSTDDVIELVIPQGTTAGSVTEITIEIVDPDTLPPRAKGSDIYQFGPPGVTFSQDVELKLKYNPAVVGENPSSLIFYQYDDNQNLIATITSTAIDDKNHIVTCKSRRFS